MRKMFRLFLCLAVLLCVMQTAAFAEVRTVTAEGTWIMGSGETLDGAMRRAYEEAYRNAAEQAGVFVQAKTEVQNNQVVKDDITTFAATVLQIQGEPDYTSVAVGKTFEMHCRLIATVDDAKVLEALAKEKELEQAMEREREKDARIAELNKQVEALGRQLQTAKTDVQKEEVQRQIKANENAVTAAQLVKEAKKINWQNHERAVSLCQQAISLDPKYAPAYTCLAQFYRNSKDYEKAFAVCQRAFTAIPDNQLPEELYSTRGNFLRDVLWDITLNQWFQANNRGAALEERAAIWKRAVELSPMEGSGYRRLADIYNRGGKKDEAREWNQKALDFYIERLNSNIYPSRAEKYYDGIAKIYKERKDYEQAAAAYTRKIAFFDETTYWKKENRPKGKAIAEGRTYIFRAECYEKMGLKGKAQQDYTKAIEWLSEAIKVDQLPSSAYHYRGLAYERLGRRSEAKRDYAKAYELKPKDKKIAADKQRSQNW